MRCNRKTIVIIGLLLSLVLAGCVDNQENRITKIANFPYEDTTAFHGDLYKYNFVNHMESSFYSSFDMMDHKYPLFIELLKEIKGLTQTDYLGSVQSYTYGIFANIESAERLSKVNLRVDPINGNIYMPIDGNIDMPESGFYKANSNVKNLVIDLLDNSGHSGYLADKEIRSAVVLENSLSTADWNIKIKKIEYQESSANDSGELSIISMIHESKSVIAMPQGVLFFTGASGKRYAAHKETRLGDVVNIRNHRGGGGDVHFTRQLEIDKNDYIIMANYIVEGNEYDIQFNKYLKPPK